MAKSNTGGSLIKGPNWEKPDKKLTIHDGRFFIVKCTSVQQVKDSVEKNSWSCTDRENRPEVWNDVGIAFSQGPVILYFNDDKCQGWYGFAGLASAPNESGIKLNIAAFGDPDDAVSQAIAEVREGIWHTFALQWITVFNKYRDETSLGFEHTKHLMCMDNVTSVNNAHHLQELDSDTAVELCKIMNIESQRMSDLADKEQAEKEGRKPKHVNPICYGDDEEEYDSDFERRPDYDRRCLKKAKSNWDLEWKKVMEKVDKMGKVILACPCGSQRYNCHNAESDMDMFIVYQAPTSALLGFKPPKTTIQNSEREKNDYTILELRRYLELLLVGDPRCVETLFLERYVMYKGSPEHDKLCEWKKLFLTKLCVEKYIRDATGARGKTMLDKWIKADETIVTTYPISKKVGKLFYIMIRLLQNGQDIVKDNTLNVYRTEHSERRKLLLDARKCNRSYKELREKVDSMEKELRKAVETYEQTHGCKSLEVNIEKWMVNLRYEQLTDELE